MHKDQTRLRIGLLGCGPISQAAHLDAIRKARNADLYAICDVAPDLTQRMAAIYEPEAVYNDYRRHAGRRPGAGGGDRRRRPVPRAALPSRRWPRASPSWSRSRWARPSRSARACATFLDGSGLALQVGNNRRFEPGHARGARSSSATSSATAHALDAWYYDSAYRYTMQDNLLPGPGRKPNSRRPAPRLESRPRALPAAHARRAPARHGALSGRPDPRGQRAPPRPTACARLDDEVEFDSGALGHLSLISPRQGDFEEGFRVHGEHGSVIGKAPLPWFQRAQVECFKDGEYRRLLGEDGYTFKRQIEGFADIVLHGKPQHGANLDDGIAAVRGLVAISHSVHTGEWVALDEVSGAVLSSEQGAMRRPSLRAVA